MTNSTTEGAPSNKRSRGNDETTATDTRRAASGSSAAVATDLASLLGPRLIPTMDLLATQPEELKGTIISRLREMLDLHATIRQGKKSHARFDKPSVDPTTGKEKTD